jgi:Acetamidase/Formamidase family
MLSIFTRKRVAVTAVLAALASGAVMAQQQGPARGSHDWAPKVPQGKHHNLAATLETVQWGWLDPREQPKLVIDSGDTVSVETMMHAHDKVQPGMTMQQVVDLRKANPGGGPHSVTGPIYVNGAEPGDVLEIRILRIEPKAWGVNFNLPGKEFPTIGALAPEMPEGHIKFFPLDLQKPQRRVQAGRRDRSAALPRHSRDRHRPRRSVPPQGRRQGRSHGAGIDAASVEERLQHGHQ